MDDQTSNPPTDPPTDPALFDAYDHAPCPRCGYENARCACPKNVPSPLSKFTEAERRRLCESVLRAVEDNRKTNATKTKEAL